jgi:cytochrome c
MKTRMVAGAFAALALAFALGSCGGGDAPDSPGDAASATDGQLTAIELEQGIGPVRDLVLGELDPELVAEGELAYVTKCSACHKMEERYVGPRLGTVLDRRTPEFVMNMILNANEMVQRHPVVRELLGQFYTPMPVQVTDPDEARAILEYLRSARIDSTAVSPPNTPSGAGGS